MSSRFGRAAVLITALLLAASCAPLPVPGDESLPTEANVDMTTIPAEWGDLEAVTKVSDHFYRLWFEDDEGTIRVVVYAGRAEQLQPKVRVIRRSGLKEASDEPAD